MNRFAVEPAVFEQLPDYCVGVVVARGLDNHSQSEAVSRMLDQAAADFAQANREANIRELPGVKACRDALARLLEQDFGCQVVTGYVDRENNVFDFE